MYGCSCVFHLASLIDVSLFPDGKKSNELNVEGTGTLLEACRKTGVERFLYCSTADVVFGNDNIFDDRKDNTRYAIENQFPVYGKTEILAEELVLVAYSASMTTVSLCPMSIHCDYDWKNLAPMFGNAFTKSTSYYVTMVITFKMCDYVYEGNVAGAFIQVGKAIRTDSTSQVAGTAFVLKDDTPRYERIKFFGPILDEYNFKPFPVSPSAWLILLFIHIPFPSLKLISHMYYYVNCPFGEWDCGEKARRSSFRIQTSFDQA